MARKVFISFLGTGFYGKCKYVSGIFCSTETRFAQQAVLELIKANEWSENDACYIFTTEKASSDNWDVSERIKYPEKELLNYTGLKRILGNMQLPFEPRKIDIPDGKDEKEIWEIFDVIFNLLNENDELHVDLTHSFRYLPMLLLVLSNYSKFLKNVKIKHISYGNFEARNIEKSEAPIVDLLPISALQDWTFAAADYLENGNVERLKDLSMSTLNPILTESKGKDESASLMRNLIRSLQLSTDDFQTCRGMNITNSVNLRELKKYLSKTETSFIKPLNPLISKIEESLSSFDESKNINNGFYAAQWCYKNGLYQQAATILQENVVTFFCNRNNIELDDEEARESINNTFKILALKIQDEKQKWIINKRNVDFVEHILANDELIYDSDLISSFSSLTDLRNDINHFGMRGKKAPLTAKRIQQRLDELINTFTSKLIDKQSSTKKGDAISPMLINLSNHPFAYWSEAQKEVTNTLFGHCIDLPFPAVDPEGDAAYVGVLADEYLEKILNISGQDNNATVHLMGEMTFTCALVNRLRENGIRCVASTTKRDTNDLGNGQKESTFSFVQFRDYY